MLNTMLASFYERDIRKMIEEIELFKNEENIWKTSGSIKNSCGNLALHIAGGLNHFFGATLGHNGYVRERSQEFAVKGIDRKEVVKQLEKVIPIVTGILGKLTPEDMDAEYPIIFDKPGTSTGHVLAQLSLHLNYHLGQVNYLRRMLES